MDRETLRTLEFEQLLDCLAGYAQTQLGRDRAHNLRPHHDPTEIEAHQTETSEFLSYLTTGGQLRLPAIEDPESILERLQVEGTTLSPAQILELARIIAAGMHLRGLFTETERVSLYPRLAELSRGISDLTNLVAVVSKRLLPNGEVDDRATPELTRIRKDLHRCRSQIHRTLESVMRAEENSVQEEIVTFRNRRFVIPVRTDCRLQVPGVVHGLSSSGQTSFVEPLKVIEQNNDLVRLREHEESEIASIFFFLTERLRERSHDIQRLVDLLGHFDFVQAKARLAEHFGCIRPRITRESRIILHNLRHLLLERVLRASHQDIVPISVQILPPNRVIVISGPNAGGKTVVLKSIGLAALMAQSGLHIPASEATLPIFKGVFADVGDQQSIASNLSTFTAHLKTISWFARRAEPPAIVLLDEVGTGTDPEEGAALGLAIVDFFRKAGVFVVATTHYNVLKLWATRTSEVLNASVCFDNDTLQPTYRLTTGIAGASSGLEIARRMDLPDGLLETARSSLSPTQSEISRYLDELQEVVAKNEAARRNLEQERTALSKRVLQIEADSRNKEEARKQEFQSELARAVREFHYQSEQLLGKLNDQAAASRLRKFARKATLSLEQAVRDSVDTMTTRSQPQPAALPQIDEGGASRNETIAEKDRVFVVALAKEGTVESIRAGSYTVRLGSLRIRARRDELEPRNSNVSSSTAPPEVVSGLPEATDDTEFSSELHVIGMTADDATDRLDKYLDQAYLRGIESVRVIHGHGRGILRKAISDFLSGHAQVESFRASPPQRGGSGATIVVMSKE